MGHDLDALSTSSNPQIHNMALFVLLLQDAESSTDIFDVSSLLSSDPNVSQWKTHTVHVTTTIPISDTIHPEGRIHLPSKVHTVRQTQPSSLPLRIVNDARLPAVGMRTSTVPINVFHSRCSILLSMSRFPWGRSTLFRVLARLQRSPRYFVSWLAGNVGRLPERTRGLRRKTKIKVRRTLMAMSNESRGIVTNRGNPIRHRPSSSEMLAMGQMKPQTAMLPKPTRIVSTPATQSQSCDLCL